MPPAAIVGIGLAAGYLQSRGQQQQQQNQNNIMQNAAQQFSPQNITQGMQGLNPQFFNAYQGQQGQTGLQQNLYNIMQNPGYIDPQLMNMPLQTSARQGSNDFVAASGRLGRSGMRGGLGDAYALANQAAQTQRDVGIQQQYSLFREQQRRADMAWVQQQYGQLMGGAQNSAQGAAGMLGQQQAPMTGMQIGGNALGSGLAGFSMMNQGQQQPQYGQQPSQPGLQPGTAPFPATPGSAPFPQTPQPGAAPTPPTYSPFGR